MRKNCGKTSLKKAKILGALFTIVSKAMKKYKRVKLSSKPRMADFAQWGCAVARVLGKKDEDFMSAYELNMDYQNDEALEASPVARIIIAFMKDRDDWSGTASDLLAGLDYLAEHVGVNTNHKRYPKDASWMWRRINEVRTNLLNAGIKVSKDDTKRNTIGRQIILERIEANDGQDTQPVEVDKNEYDINRQFDLTKYLPGED
jgi:hypothetical protein